MFDRSVRYFERLPRYNTLISSFVVKSVYIHLTYYIRLSHVNVAAWSDTKWHAIGKFSFQGKSSLKERPESVAFERNEEKTHKRIAAGNRINGALYALMRPWNNRIFAMLTTDADIRQRNVGVAEEEWKKRKKYHIKSLATSCVKCPKLYRLPKIHNKTKLTISSIVSQIGTPRYNKLAQTFIFLLLASLYFKEPTNSATLNT